MIRNNDLNEMITKNQLKELVVHDHLIKLEQLNSIFPSFESYFILKNNNTQKTEFISTHIEHVLGYPKDIFEKQKTTNYTSKIHDEDYELYKIAIQNMIEYTLNNYATEDQKKILFSIGYRIQNRGGKYINVFEQFLPINIDKKNEFSGFLSHCIVIDENVAKPIIGSIKMLNKNQEYETIFHNNYSEVSFKNILTKRELDVLRLVAFKLTSKEIAEKLHISTNTVDVHRRNIIKKLNFSNTSEIIQYCKTYNIL